MKLSSLRRRGGRRATVVALVLAVVGALVGCTGPAAAPAASENSLRPVTLMLNWTPNAHHAGIYYAKARGLYEQAGIDVTILEPGDGVGAEVAVAQRRADFGISHAEAMLPARGQGMAIEAIATILPVNDSVLMGLDSSGLTTELGSLEGRTYGGFGGPLETALIKRLATCGGADPDSIEFIEIGNVDYLAGLEQDRFDVVWVFGGWDALRARNENPGIVTLPLAAHADCIPDWYTPIVIGNSEALDADPALARTFLAATEQGYQAVIADPGAGADALLAAAPELDQRLVRDAVAYYAPRFAPDGTFGAMRESVWTEFAAFLVDAGLLTDASAAEGAWSNDYLPTR